ncbi:alpha/beta hydrolase [soil metagenome]
MLRVLRLFALPASILAVIATAVMPAQRLRPSDVDKLPSKPADAKAFYGSDPLQFGELRLPKGDGPFPVAVVIHGGCWVAEFATLQNTAAMADSLRDAGVATWNIEYRRSNNPGGGWPGTFMDVAAATDYVRELATQHPLDIKRVVAIGHSAGAHLALWAAARPKLPTASPLHREAPLSLRAAVALGGPGDLNHFSGYAAKVCGSNVVEKLMGGSADAVADRYAQGSPIQLLPLGVQQVLIVGETDPIMPAAAREAYAAAARKAGDSVELIEVPGSHFEIIAPASAAWPTVRDKVLQLLK